jgi:hypothetical protein
VKAVDIIHWTHNPFEESHWVSRLRENLTSGSDGEGLETGLIRTPRQSFTRQVFFKMAKQHLKLAKEMQCRDYDALVAHTTIVFLRYMFLTYQHRIETDDRTFGELFYACCDEVSDISFVESLYRIMTLAGLKLKKLGSYCEKTAAVFFDAAMTTALQCSGLLEKRKLVSNF